MILSGSGSDGALGAKALKDAGGLILVQDPREAGHDGMPRAVIATGAADVVLPVKELAARLAEYARSKPRVTEVIRLAERQKAADESEEHALRGIFELLRKRTGNDFSKYKRGTVLRRTARRMQLSHRTTLAEYHEYLKENAEEIQALFQDLLITVTAFFRDPAAWQALGDLVVVPLIDAADPDVPIRIWVPGCATGEEAYSLAILFQEELDRRQIDQPFTIFASDVDEGALATAREGVYPEAIAADVSEERLVRYFRAHDHTYRVADLIRERVVFAVHSLLRDPPFSRLHLVSCRNLLIYLDRELQEQVMGLFQYACRPDGYLFLGISEIADELAFSPIDKKNRIFRARPGASEDGRLPPPVLLAAPRGSLRHEREPRQTSRQATAEIHLEMLEAVAPPSLVVDGDWNLVHLSNSVSRFLRQRGGPVARQITDVVHPDLREEVHMVLHRAFEDTFEQQASQFVPVRFDGTTRRVAVIAQRHDQPDGDGRYVLLTFLEAGYWNEEESPADPRENDDVIHGLREKLRQAESRADGMRDDYQLANEDLRAANEELQSLNEEYRSTTEELETSKEELQSINEELQTVNFELKNKVEALSDANDDLENLMAATNIPTLFLDLELRIKRLTPGVAEIFNVTTRDYGRPLANFTHCLRYPELHDDLKRTLETRNPCETEVVADDGRAFICRIAPYVTRSEKVEGIVVTFVDVSKLKQAQLELRDSEEQFRALIDASAQVVWRMDAEGKVVADSPTWRAFTGQTYEQWSTAWLDMIHPEDRGPMEKAWTRAIEAGEMLATEFRLFHAPTQSYRWTSLRAVPLRDSSAAVRGWVGMHIDVNESHEAAEAMRQADKRKDDFLATLGHELRNPLAAIRSSVAVSRASGDDEESRRWAIVDRQSAHMARLIGDLLEIVRLDRGKLRLDRARVILDDTIREVVEALQPQIDSAGLELSTDVPTDLCVYADPERLVQILDNLLRNAISYSNPGGEVQITARRDGNVATVSVRDTGIGIHAEQIDTLFEPYRQVYVGRRGGGLGLGLTLVRQLVELHGGSVRALSDGPGTGSEFEFTLPVSDIDESSSSSSSELPADIARLPATRILVVDDQQDVAGMFAAMLEALGQQVAVAYDADRALQLAREQSFDTAFLDLSMPDTSGTELARRLRSALGSDTPYLVALSGYGIESRKDTEIFDHHLVKPVGIETLTDLLRSAGR